MNISNPISSEITSVEFTSLSPEDVYRLSVKQIVNPQTFHPTERGKTPVPVVGGLYDPALGASKTLRQKCSTCNLDWNHCPGHVGHVSLPIPVYNPLFFDQLLRLLRATCVFCFRFRLSRVEVDRYACKLRLIQHGLLTEAIRIDDMRLRASSKKMGPQEEEGPGDLLGESDSDGDVDNFIVRRRKWVDRAIKRGARGVDSANSARISSIADARRAAVKEFLAAIRAVKACRQCQGHSPNYRPDNSAKIFELKLAQRSTIVNAQLGLKRSQTIFNRRKPKEKPIKRRSREELVDEGITPDLEEDGGFGDAKADEEEEGEEGEDGEEEAEIPGQRRQSRRSDAGRLLPNVEVEGILHRLFENEREITQLLYQPRFVGTRQIKPASPDLFFIHVLAIPPTNFRPPQASGGDITENAVNKTLVRILQDCVNIRDHKSQTMNQDSNEAMNRLMRAFVDLQQDINAFIDSSKSPVQGMAAKSLDPGIKQKLEKKEGLFRMNMMGKRVNFAARSVISPDPNIETNEIGVPLVFATKLTYPEPVTDENYTKLTEFVRNGPDNWPGAVAIEMENGTVQKLPSDNEYNAIKRREELAKLLQTPDPLLGSSRPKKVLRHLMEDDYVLMNRQPTLHKPSLMAHKARVLKKERTIRMHYANCNTYNADFDGDEMNMHLPQNAIAQAEAKEIARTDLQYLVATSGKPLRGLIQDHLVMGVSLTNRDTFFTRSEYQQLLYSALLPERNGNNLRNSKGGRIITIPPAIIKPKALWTGKQIITTILENIRPQFFEGLTLTSRSKVPGAWWYDGCEEDQVIFHQGYLISGILDKSQLGPTEFGFIHSVYEVYGASIAGNLLSIMGRLLTKLLHMKAHTCGIDDLLLTPEGNARRRNTLEGAKTVGLELATEYVGLKDNYRESALNIRMEGVLRDENKHMTLDLKANGRTKNFTSQVIRECLPDGLVKHFPKNSFQAMTASGAKGSDVNASQISCLLGQQVLEGRRVPVMVSGKTLPCFKPYETDVRAGGYVTDRFLTGIRPQEYYFHCMAGREGLIDTAVKTSRSGYLQRCLIKGMEGMKVQYDNTVRDADGSLVQFLYGEDGLDVAKQKCLSQFKFCGQNWRSLLRRAVEDYRNADPGGTLERLAECLGYEMKINKKVGKSLKKYKKTGDLSASEVTISEYSPSRYIGSISEKFYGAREEYIKRNPDKAVGRHAGPDMIDPIPKSEFRTLLDLKYLRSVIDPGEAVGIVAGQSIGEPSTQMTLNTFHLAGHATKNVTLGIPRLREIVMTASTKIATPTMTLTMHPKVSDEEVNVFVKRCNRLVLAELVDSVSVTETTTDSSKKYLVRLNLFPVEEYKKEHSIPQEKVRSVLKNRFRKALEMAASKAIDPKRVKTSEYIGKDDSMPEIGQSVGASEQYTQPQTGGEGDDDAPRGRGGGDEEAESEDSDNEGDGDATDAKSRSRRNQDVSYDDGDDDDDDDDDNEELEESEAGDPPTDDEGLGDSMNETTDNEADSPPSSGPRRSKKELINDSQSVNSFEFDEDGQWCEIELEYPASSRKILMLGIVERACKDTVVHQLAGIKSVAKVPISDLSRVEQDAGKRKIAVEGVNFPAIWDENEAVDLNSIETNDIACLLRMYGVEAARNNIIKEMNSVFSGHAISVDTRHLNLIADIMTRGGGFVPFNRQGLQSNTSPLLKMSFETTSNFLRDTALEADFDDLTSPSARIVLGKISGMGTGSFDVVVNGLS